MEAMKEKSKIETQEQNAKKNHFHEIKLYLQLYFPTVATYYNVQFNTLTQREVAKKR